MPEQPKENKWKTIWEKKRVVSAEAGQEEFTRFCELKEANGFDVAVGDREAYYQGFYRNWLRFYDKVLDFAGEGGINSVYELGCGSGVNLYLFKNRLQNRPGFTLGGCDYSASMVESAKRAVGSGDFTCCGGDAVPPEPKYDLVMAESVFQYFESEEYAQTVLEKMLDKSNKITYLGEIHDKTYERELMEYRKKTIENYDEKYAGLQKLFLSREWLADIAQKHGKQIVFTTSENPEYINARAEFNCYIF